MKTYDKLVSIVSVLASGLVIFLIATLTPLSSWMAQSTGQTIGGFVGLFVLFLLLSIGANFLADRIVDSGYQKELQTYLKEYQRTHNASQLYQSLTNMQQKPKLDYDVIGWQVSVAQTLTRLGKYQEARDQLDQVNAKDERMKKMLVQQHEAIDKAEKKGQKKKH